MMIPTRMIAGALALAFLTTSAFAVPQGTPAPSVPTGPWGAYTPSVSVSSPGATPPTFGTLVGRYQVTGKRVDFRIEVPIVKTNTGGGNIQVSLPVPAAGSISVTGYQGGTVKQMTGLLSGSAVTLIMTNDQSYPGADNTTLYVSGSYEAQ